MAKRAAAACQAPPISQRPRRRRKKTPDDAASASGLRSSGTTTSSRNRLWQQPKTLHDAAPGLPRRTLPIPVVSWGAKRRRTVRFGTALGGSRWRDWAGLDEGPAGLIADRVLANDVADYVRFRSTCLPWRRCCADPRARGVLEDPRLYPRQWIMLRDDDYEKLKTAGDAAAHGGIRRRFLNTRTGQCVQVDIPELRDHGVPRATADGLLVLLHYDDTDDDKAVVRLLNPLTRQMAELPPTTGFVCIDECSPCCAGLLDQGTVFLYFYCGYRFAGTMAIARPGDDRWALFDAGSSGLMRSTVYFAGRFYGFNASGIVTVDMAGGRGPRRLVVAAEHPRPFTFSPATDTVHLVDNGDGDLRLVHCTLRRVRGYVDRYGLAIASYNKWMYKVYRVNLSTGKTTNRGCRDLGGRAIFIDLYGGLSVSARVFPFLIAGTVYLGLHYDERHAGGEQIGAYHVGDGSIEPPCNDDRQTRRLAHPLSIADSLIAYVSG